MTVQWPSPNRTGETRLNQQLKNRTGSLSFRQRFDFVLVLGGGLGLGLLALLVLVTFLFGDRLGFLPKVVLRPIPDERLLVNIRQDLEVNPLLHGVLQVTQGAVVLTQAGGNIHHYRPATRLWSTEETESLRHEISSDLVRLNVNSGATSKHAANTPVDLWALSAQGGLARFGSGKWKTVVGDNLFLGADGQPISSVDLTTAAVSQDRRWLAVGTEKSGFGLYYIPTRSWLTLEPAVFQALPSQNVTHLVWWRERIWIGGPKGLVAMKMVDRNPVVEPQVNLSYAIVDMDADPSGALWVLAKKSCRTGGDNCLWLGAFKDPEQRPNVLVDEENIFPELDLANLNFAVDLGDRLVLAGKAGLFSYHQRFHNWHRHLENPVSAAFRKPGDETIYFGYRGGLGAFANGMVRRWPLAGEQPLKLFAGPEGRVLALTTDGRLYEMDEQHAPKILFRGAGSGGENLSFTKAVSLDDMILLLGPDGGLLHDVTTRQYLDLPKKTLPFWLLDPAARMVFSGNHLFVFTSDRGRSQLFLVSKSEILSGRFLGEKKKLPLIRTQDLKIRKWGSYGVSVLDSFGQAFRYDHRNQVALVGPPERALDSLTLFDVTQFENGWVATTSRGVWHYNLRTRNWSDLSQPPLGERFVELDSHSSRLLLRTQKGRLYSSPASRVPYQFQPLIGSKTGLSIADQALSDAMVSEERLFLAGEGKVEVYDTQNRKMAGGWNLKGSNSVSIAAIQGGKPLVLSGGRAFFGQTAIDPQAGEVTGVGLEAQRLWTVRKKEARVFLKTYDLGSNYRSEQGRCYFRNPSPSGPIGQVFDGCALPDGNILLATDVGLRFYDTKSRSWFDGPGNLLSKGGRVFLIDDELVLAEPKKQETLLHIVPLNTIAMPNRCSQDPVSMKQILRRVKAYTVDLASGQLAMLTLDESVRIRQLGKEWQALAKAEQGPDPDTFLRVFARTGPDQGEPLANQTLMFATGKAVWRYNLSKRNWSQVQLDFPGPVPLVDDIGMETRENQESVLVRTQAGDFYHGLFRVIDQTVEMNKVYTHQTQGFEATPAELLDAVGNDDSIWKFLLRDRLKYFDPMARQWLADVPLGLADDTMAIGNVGGWPVITAKGGTTWLVSQGDRDTETDFEYQPRFARYDLQPKEKTALHRRELWRLDNQGQLARCQGPDGATYQQFEPVGPKPFLLAEGEVSQAFRWGNLYLLAGNRGLRAYHSRDLGEVTLPPETTAFGTVEKARFFDGAWLALGEKGLLWLYRSGRDGVGARLFPQVKRFAQDLRDTPWISDPEGWRVWTGTRFETPAAPVGSQGFAIRVVDGGTVTGTDETGRMYVWEDAWLPQPFLFPKTLPRDTAVLCRGLGEDWWAIRDERLYHYKPQACGTSATGLCLEKAGEILLPEDFRGRSHNAFIRFRSMSSGMVDMVLKSGKTLKVSTLSGSYQTQVSRVLPPMKHRCDDQWQQLAKFVVKTSSGQTQFNPVLDFSVDSKGALVARRPMGDQVLAQSGGAVWRADDALDTGWMRWRRESEKFELDGVSGPVSFAKSEFIVRGRMLFEGVAAVLDGDQYFYAANEHGIWRHQQGDLRLNDPSMVFRRQPLSLPVRAAHGRFMTDTGDLVPGGSGFQAPTRVHRVRFGDVVLSEDTMKCGVSGSIRVKGQSRKAFGERGFLWDRKRLGLAFDKGALLLQSGAGIHALKTLREFDLGPPGSDLSAGSLWSEPGEGLFMVIRDSWYHRTDGTWRRTEDPTIERELVGNDTWTWQLRNGSLTVALRGQAHNFSFGSRGFSSDHLRAATVTGDSLFLMSDGFLEIADGPADLGAMKGQRFPPKRTNRMETQRFAGGRQRVLRHLGTSVSVWNPVDKLFQDGGVLTEDAVALTPNLRFFRRGGSLVKEMLLETPAGRKEWVPYRLQAGQFPFDIVTTMASHENMLYLGTRAGLQVYKPGFPFSLNAIHKWIDLRGNQDQSLSQIGIRMGRPKALPETLVIQAGTHTLVKPAGGDLQIGTYQPLEERLRIRSDFWQWTQKTMDGTVSGHYLQMGGRLIPGAIEIGNGRFPHDRFQDLAFWDQTAFALWGKGVMTQCQPPNLRLDDGAVNLSFTSGTPNRFLIVDRAYSSDRTRLKKGLYAGGSKGGFWHYKGGRWVPVDRPEIIHALSQFEEKQPVFAAKDLRLVPLQNRRLRFQHRTSEGAWHNLKWRNGRLAIDRWQNGALVGGDFWAATEDGLVPFKRSAKGTMVIDPDDLDIRSVVPRENQITDMTMQNGRLLLRCNESSEQLFSGDLAVREPFKLRPGADPFADRVLVATGPEVDWQWQLLDRRNGKPGYLTCIRNGHPLSLVGGKFDFDTVNSLGLFAPGILDVGTDSGGWYRTDRSTQDPFQLKRPTVTDVDPLQIKTLGITKVGERLQLALNTFEGQTIKIDAKGGIERSETFLQFLGEDALWRYYQDGQGLTVSPLRTLAGDGRRQLDQGRFNDDKITGFPIFEASENGSGYWLPTEAGILRVNNGLGGEAMVFPPFNGLEEGEVPTVLFKAQQEAPAYVARSHFHKLLGDQETLAPLRIDAPDGFEVRHMAPGEDGDWRLSWETETESGWNRLQADSFNAFPRNTLWIDVRGLPSYVRNRVNWGDPKPLLVVTFAAGELKLGLEGLPTGEIIPLPDQFVLVEPIVTEKSLLLFGKNHLLELDLGVALENLFRGQATTEQAQLKP